MTRLLLLLAGAAGGLALLPAAGADPALTYRLVMPAAVREVAPPDCYIANQDGCNCEHFANQRAAASFSTVFDPLDHNHLDADNDGLPCEHLPA